MIPAHRRIAFTGTLNQQQGGGTEIFSFGFASTSTEELSTLANAVGAAMVTIWGAGGDYTFPASAVLRACVAEDILSGGKVNNSYRADLGSTPGVITPTAFPTILSYAATLETGVLGNKGRKVRGRFYPPTTSGTQIVGATCLLVAAEQMRDGIVAICNSLNDAGAAMAVASRESGGIVVPVTGITVDTVVDTQRRRKNHVTSQRSPVGALS